MSKLNRLSKFFSSKSTSTPEKPAVAKEETTKTAEPVKEAEKTKEEPTTTTTATEEPTMNKAAISSSLELLKGRRTIYDLKAELPAGVTEAEITALVNDYLKYTPSAFNIQNVRAVIYYGDASKKFWDGIYEAANGAPYGGRAKSLSETAYGTILFFNDQAIIDDISTKVPFYKEDFPIWAEHANGAIQISIWTAFHGLGLGANLQHMNLEANPLLADKFEKSWKYVSALAFGVPAKPAGEKTFADTDAKVYTTF